VWYRTPSCTDASQSDFLSVLTPADATTSLTHTTPTPTSSPRLARRRWRVRRRCPRLRSSPLPPPLCCSTAPTATMRHPTLLVAASHQRPPPLTVSTAPSPPSVSESPPCHLHPRADFPACRVSTYALRLQQPLSPHPMTLLPQHLQRATRHSPLAPASYSTSSKRS
jgi:hypothetical protein